MPTTFEFYLDSILLGVALAMDAFSVSLANGLNEPCMRPRKAVTIAGIFGLFQGIMPLLGWVLIFTASHWFQWLSALIPWVALGLLSFIGIKMLCEGVQNKDCGDVCACGSKLGIKALLVQGVATSIDALSAGLNFAAYSWIGATVASLLIALITFGLCVAGVEIGKKTGTRLAGKAGIVGGVILILIGIKIFATR